jgi:hypothetical protein
VDALEAEHLLKARFIMKTISQRPAQELRETLEELLGVFETVVAGGCDMKVARRARNVLASVPAAPSPKVIAQFEVGEPSPARHEELMITGSD